MLLLFQYSISDEVTLPNLVLYYFSNRLYSIIFFHKEYILLYHFDSSIIMAKYCSRSLLFVIFDVMWLGFDIHSLFIMQPAEAFSSQVHLHTVNTGCPTAYKYSFKTKGILKYTVTMSLRFYCMTLLTTL